MKTKIFLAMLFLVMIGCEKTYNKKEEVGGFLTPDNTPWGEVGGVREGFMRIGIEECLRLEDIEGSYEEDYEYYRINNYGVEIQVDREEAKDGGYCYYYFE